MDIADAFDAISGYEETLVAQGEAMGMERGRELGIEEGRELGWVQRRQPVTRGGTQLNLSLMPAS